MSFIERYTHIVYSARLRTTKPTKTRNTHFTIAFLAFSESSYRHNCRSLTHGQNPIFSFSSRGLGIRIMGNTMDSVTRNVDDDDAVNSSRSDMRED